MTFPGRSREAGAPGPPWAAPGGCLPAQAHSTTRGPAASVELGHRTGPVRCPPPPWEHTQRASRVCTSSSGAAPREPGHPNRRFWCLRKSDVGKHSAYPDMRDRKVSITPTGCVTDLQGIPRLQEAIQPENPLFIPNTPQDCGISSGKHECNSLRLTLEYNCQTYSCLYVL